MYEVVTATKTIATTLDLETALRFAEDPFVHFHYVEVLRVDSVTPWSAHSVKILMR